MAKVRLKIAKPNSIPVNVDRYHVKRAAQDGEDRVTSREYRAGQKTLTEARRESTI